MSDDDSASSYNWQISNNDNGFSHGSQAMLVDG